MIKWEYSWNVYPIVSSPDAKQKQLNAKGEVGWELVSTHITGESITYMFKRPKHSSINSIDEYERLRQLDP